MDRELRICTRALKQRCVAQIPMGEEPREERKIITVVFADLVDFTSRAEQLDPEDLRGLLAPYFAHLRSELERWGGTVEKFIGDAVVAVFGAPITHEDDAERAMRSALAIRDWVLAQDWDLQVRVGVNTGEALVALDGRPGEGIATGDVMSTASRLQAAAPANGVVVGEATRRLTYRTVTYGPAIDVAAKGKAALVRAWEALRAAPELSDQLMVAPDRAMVGRTHELALLGESLRRARRDRAPRLVVLSGVPGIGKSRLLAEFQQQVRSDARSPTGWLQGRALPYGEGVTFWALGEMVKRQAGILETDSPADAGHKLRAALRGLGLSRPERRWLARHMGALVGAEATSDARNEAAREATMAWRRYLEALASRQPLVLAFEDLHWAGEELLDFIEAMAASARGCAMLIVGTTRPELLERRPHLGDGAAVHRIRLQPLSAEETESLLAALTEGVELSAETRAGLLSHAAGNPLYAEQYVRMLAELPDVEGTPLPATVQGVIAARVDALPVAEKRLLQNAAVIGKVFWKGALAHEAGSTKAVINKLLAALERKEFVRRSASSVVADESEFSFAHILIRDVAYASQPRPERASRHHHAALWISSLGRPADHAEMIADHYLSALALRRAAGIAHDHDFVRDVLRSVSDAADRATSLSAHAAAQRFYESALQLAAPDSLERAQLIFKLARARHVAGYMEIDLLTAAYHALLATGEEDAAAEAQATLGELEWLRGNLEEAQRHLTVARALVERREASAAKASVLSSHARMLMIIGEDREGLAVGRQALEIAEQLALPHLRAHALNTIGISRVHAGDSAGLDDLQRSIALAAEFNHVEGTLRGMANFAATLWEQGQLNEARASLQEGEDQAERFGHTAYARWFRGLQVEAQYVMGAWDDAVEKADLLIAEVEAGSPYNLAARWYATRALIRTARDHDSGALSDAECALELSRSAKDAQTMYATLSDCAHVFRDLGRSQMADSLAEEFIGELRRGARLSGAREYLHRFAWMLMLAGRGQELTVALPVGDSPWAQIAIALLAAEVSRAADLCRDIGAVSDEARQRLWLANHLAHAGRAGEAEAQLVQAISFYRAVGATRYIGAAERLLAYAG